MTFYETIKFAGEGFGYQGGAEGNPGKAAGVKGPAQRRGPPGCKVWAAGGCPGPLVSAHPETVFLPDLCVMLKK